MLIALTKLRNYLKSLDFNSHDYQPQIKSRKFNGVNHNSLKRKSKIEDSNYTNIQTDGNRLNNKEKSVS